MADPLIVQQRTVDVFSMQLETFAESGAILDSQRRALAERRQYRVGGVAQYGDPPVMPAWKSVHIIQAPLRRSDNAARQCHHIVHAHIVPEGDFHVPDHLRAVCGKPVAFIAFEFIRIRLVVAHPDIKQFTATHPVGDHVTEFRFARIHTGRIDGVVVHGAAIFLGQFRYLRARDQAPVTDDKCPAPGGRIGVNEFAGYGIDAIRPNHKLSRIRSAVPEGDGSQVVGLGHRIQAFFHVYPDWTICTGTRSKIVAPLVQAHQQVETVHMMITGAVIRRGIMIKRFYRDGAVIHHHARGFENRSPAAVHGAVRAFRIAAGEIDTEPFAQAGAIGRHGNAGPGSAWFGGLFVNVN